MSKDFNEELLKSKRKPGSDLSIDSFGEHLKKYFALPDYQSIMKGFVKRDDESVSAEEQVGIQLHKTICNICLDFHY